MPKLRSVMGGIAGGAAGFLGPLQDILKRQEEDKRQAAVDKLARDKMAQEEGDKTNAAYQGVVKQINDATTPEALPTSADSALQGIPIKAPKPQMADVSTADVPDYLSGKMTPPSIDRSPGPVGQLQTTIENKKKMLMDLIQSHAQSGDTIDPSTGQKNALGMGGQPTGRITGLGGADTGRIAGQEYLAKETPDVQGVAARGAGMNALATGQAGVDPSIMGPKLNNFRAEEGIRYGFAKMLQDAKAETAGKKAQDFLPQAINGLSQLQAMYQNAWKHTQENPPMVQQMIPGKVGQMLGSAQNKVQQIAGVQPWTAPDIAEYNRIVETLPGLLAPVLDPKAGRITTKMIEQIHKSVPTAGTPPELGLKQFADLNRLMQYGPLVARSLPEDAPTDLKYETIQRWAEMGQRAAAQGMDTFYDPITKQEVPTFLKKGQ